VARYGYGYGYAGYGGYGPSSAAASFSPPAAAPVYTTQAAQCYCTAVTDTPPPSYRYSAPPPSYRYGYPPPSRYTYSYGYPPARGYSYPPPASYSYGYPPPRATGYTFGPPPRSTGYSLSPPSASTSGYSYGYGYQYGGYGYGYGYGSRSSASVRGASTVSTIGSCYCKFDTITNSFDLSAPTCKSALYSKCASGSMLACSTLDSFYSSTDLGSKQAISEFLFEDCPPEAPCACQALSFNGNETSAQKGDCCANLRVACQPLFGGLACDEVEAFCSDNLASPMLNKYVQHKLHDAVCEANPTVAAAPTPSQGLTAGQVAGIVIGALVGVAVLAGVAYSVLKSVQVPAAGAGTGAGQSAYMSL
jgi:hypothetical protein